MGLEYSFEIETCDAINTGRSKDSPSENKKRALSYSALFESGFDESNSLTD